MDSKTWYIHMGAEALSRYATVPAPSDYLGVKMEGLGSGMYAMSRASVLR